MKPRHNWKRITRLMLSVLFCAWIVFPGQAREKTLKFDHVIDLGVETTQAFYQDSEGFLWIGSLTSGLFRYDGYELKHYGIGLKLLANGNVTRIIEDTENPNILWLATLEGGFSRFDKETDTFTHYTYHPKNPQGLAAPLVYDILQDSKHPDILWIAGDGLFQKFDKQTQTFSPNKLNQDIPGMPEDMQFFSITEDRVDPNILWIAACGLMKFDKTTEQFSVYLHDPKNPNSLGFESNYIGSIAQDQDDPDILWLGYWDGPVLDKFDQRTATCTHYRHDPNNPNSLRDGGVQLIYDDGDGTLWLGGWADGNGLTAFDKKSATFATYRNTPENPYSISSDMIVSVWKDRSGILWVVNMTGKIDKLDPQSQNFTLYQANPLTANSLVNNAVYSIYEDRDGLMWFGTASGLSKFDPEMETFTNYTHHPDNPDTLDGNYVLCTYQDSARNFWVGLYAHPLLKFDKEIGRVVERIEVPEGSGISEIIEDPDDPDILWLGVVYNVGFARYDKRSRQMTYYPPNPDHPEKGVNSVEITQVLHDKQEKVIWLGSLSGHGLSRFDKITGTFTHYVFDPDNPKSLSHDNIGAIYQDTSGGLWIGTLGGGLNKFNKQTETFTRYTEEQGVPAFVNTILEDKQGDLWLSTDSGIVRFNPKTKTVDKRYVKIDGLQGNAFLYGSGLKTKSGEMWFGGTNGVNRFHPNQLRSNPYVPPVVLTALTQGGEMVNWDNQKVPARIQRITLDWKQNFFEFEYAALNYTIPEKNQYRYKLEGLERDWYNAGNRRTGRYSGIPAGTYTLRIIGSNNDGVWNKEGVSLQVVVIPPFWQTRWFYAACATGILLLFLVILYLRTRRLQKFNKILRQKLDERTEQLNKANAEITKLEKEQLERQMAGGFAHEMRNALVSVIIGLNMVIENEKTLCQQNVETLGSLFDLLEPSIPPERRQEVITVLKTIDQNEETLDTVLKKTKESTTRALDVTKLILEYSRVGRTGPGRDQVNLQELVDRVFQEHTAKFAEQGIDLSTQVTATYPLIAHTSHIHSIINNLVLNARDALLEVKDDRQRLIEITVKEDGNTHILMVKDNANGIPEEHRAKIFEPFFSTKPTTGTGLGLSYVFKLVSLYHGAIDLTSEIGKGTTFTITFPLQQEQSGSS